MSEEPPAARSRAPWRRACGPPSPPLDQRVFGVPYPDEELLGKAVDPRPGVACRSAIAMHVSTARCSAPSTRTSRPRCRVPAWARGPAAGLAEHLATWPLTLLIDERHPARDEMPQLADTARAFAQATWRHLLFGVILGELERRLNPPEDAAAPPSTCAPCPSNGHGDIEQAVGASEG